MRFVMLFVLTATAGRAITLPDKETNAPRLPGEAMETTLSRLLGGSLTGAVEANRA